MGTPPTNLPATRTSSPSPTPGRGSESGPGLRCSPSPTRIDELPNGKSHPPHPLARWWIPQSRCWFVSDEGVYLGVVATTTTTRSTGTGMVMTKNRGRENRGKTKRRRTRRSTGRTKGRGRAWCSLGGGSWCVVIGSNYLHPLNPFYGLPLRCRLVPSNIQRELGGLEGSGERVLRTSLRGLFRRHLAVEPLGGPVGQVDPDTHQEGGESDPLAFSGAWGSTSLVSTGSLGPYGDPRQRPLGSRF